MSLSITKTIHFRPGRRGRRQLAEGPKPEPAPQAKVPRITRLMALAIRLQKLVEEGEVTDYAELASLGHVSRARVTQIMNLLHLAPDIQEELLFLPETETGLDAIAESVVRPICAVVDWHRQRALWRALLPSAYSDRFNSQDAAQGRKGRTGLHFAPQAAPRRERNPDR